jgi:hypothetical protein
MFTKVRPEKNRKIKKKVTLSGYGHSLCGNTRRETVASGDENLRKTIEAEEIEAG